MKAVLILNKKFFDSRCWIMWLATMCSNILQHVLISETGLQLAGSNLSPDLNTGTTLAVSQSLGSIH